MKKYTVLTSDYVGDKPLVVQVSAERFGYVPVGDHREYLVFYVADAEVARFSSYASFWSDDAAVIAVSP